MSHVKVAIYARVSTDEQTVDQQLEALRGDCLRHGWQIAEEVTDTISGSNFTRKGMDRLMMLVRRKKVDLIVCHKLDRLGRSLPHLAQMISEFDAHGVALFVPGQGIDTRTNNPAGRLQMNILMAVADFERSLISERTKLKLRALKAAGKKLGRPRLPSNVLERAQALFSRDYGRSYKPPTCQEMADELGISIGSAYRVRKSIMVASAGDFSTVAGGSDYPEATPCER